MRPLRRLPAALALISLLTQATGAADLALVMGPAARPMLYPAPTLLRFPAPAPKKIIEPPRSRFWKDCAVVARWAYDRVVRGPEPVASARLSRHAPPPLVEKIGPAPEPKPSSDRMMIVKDPMIVDAAEAVRGLSIPDGEGAIYRKRVEGKWHDAPGLRYRVVYKDSFGLTWGDAEGFHFYMPGYKQVDIPLRLPPAIYGEYPVYFHGQSANFDIELENTGAAPLESIRVEAQQETFDEKGSGRPTDDLLVKRVRAIKPGARVVLHGQFYVSNSGNARVNLEQTHLRISASGRWLADEAHAGIVDPPNLSGL